MRPPSWIARRSLLTFATLVRHRTCGDVAASAKDVAQFYFDLLGPSTRPVLTPASVAIMKNTSVISQGWEKGHLQYGYGSMITSVSPLHAGRLPTLSTPGTYIGHGGDTYGFESDNGFYPTLNASISIIVNQDIDQLYPQLTVGCCLKRNLEALP